MIWKSLYPNQLIWLRRRSVKRSAAKEEDEDEDEDEEAEEEEEEEEEPPTKKAKSFPVSQIGENRLPKGWRAYLKTRNTDGAAYKVYVSPEGKDFDRWSNIKKYLEKNWESPSCRHSKEGSFPSCKRNAGR